MCVENIAWAYQRHRQDNIVHIEHSEVQYFDTAHPHNHIPPKVNESLGKSCFFLQLPALCHNLPIVTIVS